MFLEEDGYKYTVSGEQCHLIILRMFSWPSLAYVCTKVAQKPINEWMGF